MEDDLERGQRIKELRKARHRTQPSVADAVGVTLRAYQEWEAGGGIAWENVKLLAKELDTHHDFILSGIDRTETPDPFSGQEGEMDRLGRIEQDITKIKESLEGLQSAVLAVTAELLRQAQAQSAKDAEDPPLARPEGEN